MSDHVPRACASRPDDPVDWEFHRHLDGCEQCRKFPFNLCPVGAAALERTAIELAQKALKGAK